MKLSILACIAISLITGGAFGQTQCRVLDPDLADQYHGGCRDGLAEGFGEARGIAEYRGEFRAGRKHGKGIKVWMSLKNSGDRYEGEFVDDRKEGIGTYVWSPSGPSSGERYSGPFLNDRRHGVGTYEWPSGDRYIGPWEADSPIGALTAMMKARVLAETAANVAVGRLGVKVCRAVPIGIGSSNWIRGEVIQAEASRIAVTIDDPGQQAHLMGKALLLKGTILWSPALDWIPCS